MSALATQWSGLTVDGERVVVLAQVWEPDRHVSIRGGNEAYASQCVAGLDAWAAALGEASRRPLPPVDDRALELCA